MMKYSVVYLNDRILSGVPNIVYGLEMSLGVSIYGMDISSNKN